MLGVVCANSSADDDDDDDFDEEDEPDGCRDGGVNGNHPLCAADCRMYVCGLCACGGVAGCSGTTSSLDLCQLSWGSSSCLLSCALPTAHTCCGSESLHTHVTTTLRTAWGCGDVMAWQHVSSACTSI